MVIPFGFKEHQVFGAKCPLYKLESHSFYIIFNHI